MVLEFPQTSPEPCNALPAWLQNPKQHRTRQICQQQFYNVLANIYCFLVWNYIGPSELSHIPMNLNHTQAVLTLRHDLSILEQ